MVARKLKRSPKALRNMLKKHHLSLRDIRCDRLSLESLAIALRINKSEIHFWIDQGWLQAIIKTSGKRKFYNITPETLTLLHKRHLPDLLKRGVPNLSLFEAYLQYCYSPKHTVGEQFSDARRDKKEQAAYATRTWTMPADTQSTGELINRPRTHQAGRVASAAMPNCTKSASFREIVLNAFCLLLLLAILASIVYFAEQSIEQRIEHTFWNPIWPEPSTIGDCCRDHPRRDTHPSLAILRPQRLLLFNLKPPPARVADRNVRFRPHSSSCSVCGTRKGNLLSPAKRWRSLLMANDSFKPCLATAGIPAPPNARNRAFANESLGCCL